MEERGAAAARRTHASNAVTTHTARTGQRRPQPRRARHREQSDGASGRRQTKSNAPQSNTPKTKQGCSSPTPGRLGNCAPLWNILAFLWVDVEDLGVTSARLGRDVCIREHAWCAHETLAVWLSPLTECSAAYVCVCLCAGWELMTRRRRAQCRRRSSGSRRPKTKLQAHIALSRKR